MSDDYLVPKRKNKEIRAEALRAKKFDKTEKRRPVNIIRCLESGKILTRRGPKQLIYKKVDDALMGDRDGKTEYTGDAVVISVKRSIYQKAFWGDGRARMTLAHELGHGAMHHGPTLSRSTDAVGTTDLSQTRALESAEHQAKVFAAAFLIEDEVAAGFSSPEEISAEFVVSLDAAEICFERLLEEAEHARSAERVHASNQDFKTKMQEAIGAKPKQELQYTGDYCLICGNATLIPMGIKLLCHTCGDVSDPR
jgi:Zn-dependent peptidase ImmA (M78 family)